MGSEPRRTGKCGTGWTMAVVVFVMLNLSLPLAAEGESFADNPAATKYAVILVGATASEARAGEFGNWALALYRSLREDYGYAAEHLRLLGAVGRADMKGVGPCRAESIRALFDNLAATIAPGDQLNLFLIGHGTGRGDLAKFNIVGPDLTGAEFGELLDTINTSDIVVVNTTSASRDFSQALSAKGRVVVSATRSPAEKYDTVFPGYFVEALQQHAADRDKNGRVSILEAFNHTQARVAKHFRAQSALPSEHATVDDNGDGVFSVKPDPQGDGRLAEIAYLDVAGAAAHRLSPAAASLRARMSNLERDVFLLRANKASLGESEYWARLEPLLVELAKASREFDEQSSP
jgi:hypothetical protein